MEGYLTVLVKGKGEAVFNQLDARGIKAFMVDTQETTTVVWTSKDDDQLKRVADWFGEDPAIIPGYGFADGVCLLYSHHEGDPSKQPTYADQFSVKSRD